MNPLIVAPPAIGAAGIAAHTAMKASGASFGQLLSLGEKSADSGSAAADQPSAAAPLDSLFAASGQLSGDSFEQLSETTDQLVAEIEAALRQLLEAEGINPSSEFQLSINEQGEIDVDGAGTADEALARLINGDADLATKIRQAAANRSLLQSTADHHDFSTAQGPQQSLDAYQALFGEQRSASPLFTFRADEGLSLDLA